MNNVWSNTRIDRRGSRYRDLDHATDDPFGNNNNEHDDRGSGGRGRYNTYINRGGGGGRGGYNSGAMRNYQNKSRGSFKKTFRGGVQSHYKNQRAGPRVHLDVGEDDETMEGDQAGPSRGGRKRFSPYGARGKNNRRGTNHSGEDVMRRLGVPVSRGRGASNRGRFSGGPSSWFKVKVPYGAKQNQEDLLKNLLNRTSQPFVPREFQKVGRDAFFYIQGSTAAEALRLLSGTFEFPSGFKAYINVSPSPAPKPRNLTPEKIGHLKVAMSARYDPASKALNLSEFCKDDALTSNDVFLTFYNSNHVRELLTVINENIPELESLDISKNDIVSLGVFNTIAEKAPNMKRLNLGNNKIRELGELKTLRSVSLLELCLDGNSMCDKFSDEDSYVSEIRKFFPGILRLDGHDLPPPITFDLGTVGSLPPSQGSNFGSNEEVKTLICKFIQQYFQLYDNTDRSGLLEAYHDNASLSWCCYDNNAISGWQPRLSDYFDQNRNHKRNTNPKTRQAKLIKGRINIVQRLGTLPKCEHDLNNFVVDVIVLTTSMLTFSVQGVFREKTTKDTSYTRVFNRVFITVPRGDGISILNEQLTITNATKKTTEKSFVSIAAPSPAVTATSPGPAVSQAAPPTVTPEQQAQLLQQFCVQSGMNAEWSGKCLQENKWNYELAAKMFTELQAKGAIPQEAFVK